MALLGNERLQRGTAAIQEVLDAVRKKLQGVSQETSTVVEVEPMKRNLRKTKQKLKKAEVAARNAIVAEMKAKIGYKAQVVPFNTATWVEGVVTGCWTTKEQKIRCGLLKILRVAKYPQSFWF